MLEKAAEAIFLFHRVPPAGNTAEFSVNNVLFNIFIISVGAGNVKKS